MTTNATPRGFPESHNADRDAGQSLRAGIEALDDGFTLWDAHDRLVLANARYLEIFPVLVGWLRPGRSFVECIREIAQRMYAQRPVAARDGFIAESVKQHGARVASRDHIRPDGITLRVIERPTGDGGTVTIYRDVTSEQRAAERLARSEAQFRDGILSMADGFVLWGPDRRLRTWNDQLLQIMPHLRSVLAVDMTLAEFIEAACNAAYPDWSKSQRQDWTRDRLVSAWTSSHRADLELADDRFVTITQNRTSDGGLVATYRDMTTEVRATRRLVDSESGSRRLALAATNVQSGIVILDSRSRITWTNPAMAGMVGISPDALLGLTPRAAFISDQTPPESFARIAEALNSRQRARADLVLRRPDGTTFWVELDAAPDLQR